MDTPYDFTSAPEVPSTQDLARARFAGRPLVWMAHRQTAGRGRTGRTWLTADEAVAVSLAFAPEWPVERWPLLSLVAGLAAVDDLSSHGVADVGLKWPNDIMTRSGKVGGILVEAAAPVVVVGMGLNLLWRRPPEGMAGLWPVPPATGFREVLARGWAERVLARVASGPDAWGRDEYLGLCRTIGRTIEWEPAGVGKAVGVDVDGGLIVETEAGCVVLRSADVREIRRASGSVDG